MFCLSGRFFSVFLPQATLSLACGYENSAFQAVLTRHSHKLPSATKFCPLAPDFHFAAIECEVKNSPHNEALCRRTVKGERLYQIDTLADIINLV